VQVIQDRWRGGRSFGTAARLIGRPQGLWPAQMAVPPDRMFGWPVADKARGNRGSWKVWSLMSDVPQGRKAARHLM
jgi:hypothetical protein